jgi:hypothetical protein
VPRRHRDHSGTARDDNPDPNEDGRDQPPDAAKPDGSADHRIGSAGGGPYPPTTAAERDASQQ